MEADTSHVYYILKMKNIGIIKNFYLIENVVPKQQQQAVSYQSSLSEK